MALQYFFKRPLAGMTALAAGFLLSVAGGVFQGAALAAAPPAATTAVYFNGKVYTSDTENPSATAFVVENGKFVYVGDDAGALRYGKGTDLQGKRILPGIIDSHCHPVMTTSLNAFDLIRVKQSWNMRQTLAHLKEKAYDDAHKDLPFILGIGFGTDCRPVRAADLDTILPDRPAVIMSSDGHAYWFNSKAMELAGLTRDTPDPVPGASFYERDAKGDPTGYVVEAPAGFTLLRKMGIFTADALYGHFPATQALFNKHGITSIYEASFGMLSEADALEALTRLEKDGGLNLRIFTSYSYYGKSLDSPGNMLNIMKDNQEKYTSELLKADTLKMFVDGTLDVMSSWMFEDYFPPGKGHGTPMMDFDDMLAAGGLAAGSGFSVHIHAIGDRAISTALDLHERLGKIAGTRTVCHVQFPPEDGVKRFGDLKDVFYQCTPAWLEDDAFTRTTLGEARYLRQVPLASLLKAEVTLTFGSDFPVSEGEYGLNPFINMWTAVNRSSDPRFAPPKNEDITVKDCVDAYTINGAKQLSAADVVGSITVGKSADFVVCSDDIFAIEPQKLKDVTVEKTYLRGTCVFARQ